MFRTSVILVDAVVAISLTELSADPMNNNNRSLLGKESNRFSPLHSDFPDDSENEYLLQENKIFQSLQYSKILLNKDIEKNKPKSSKLKEVNNTVPNKGSSDSIDSDLSKGAVPFYSGIPYRSENIPIEENISTLCAAKNTDQNMLESVHDNDLNLYKNGSQTNDKQGYCNSFSDERDLNQSPSVIRVG